ncbi:phosphatases II [Testicularia cyperi]|uniref:Phosphatases II n=1 Tax=Testicularia cyperi TaxID=1882483 RepID=A0A317XWZ4_9BASI|nr:phosphatases II [Testicularia cyperi]
MALASRPTTRAIQELFSVLDYTDQVRLSQPSLGYSISRSQESSNVASNRYRDIYSYDHALLPGEYLNASMIPPMYPCSMSFIASQAPLPSTLGAFYRHLVKQKIRALVNLTPCTENGRLKAHQYWPDSTDDKHAIQLDNGWTVTLDDQKDVQLAGGKATLVRRRLQIHTSSKATATGGWGITQLHLSTWPDHGTFPTDLLLEVMSQVGLVPTPRIFPPPPVWIHCSAGVGRSGTLAAAMIAQAIINLHKANNSPDSSSFNAVGDLLQRSEDAHIWDLPTRIVEHFRRFRPRMVQTETQFAALFDIVRLLVQSKQAA